MQNDFRFNVSENANSWYVSDDEGFAMRIDKVRCQTRDEALLWYITNRKNQYKTNLTNNDLSFTGTHSKGAAPKKQDIIIKIVGVISFIVVFYLVRESGEGTSILSGGFVGFICGLLPYFIFKNKDVKFSRISIYSCTLSGMVLGIILAAPTALVFTFIGYKKQTSIK
jgi:hypothetical protein